MLGSRVKATPVPERGPVLPNTMAWIVTAVPSKASIFSILRYSSAFLPQYEAKTAPIAATSCARGSSGKAAPLCFR